MAQLSLILHGSSHARAYLNARTGLYQETLLRKGSSGAASPSDGP